MESVFRPTQNQLPDLREKAFSKNQLHVYNEKDDGLHFKETSRKNSRWVSCETYQVISQNVYNMQHRKTKQLMWERHSAIGSQFKFPVSQ